ncbi:MAG: hypothetical protein L6262_09100 [Weeksellaceae bacterium]|nr:hypothetical protein [Weeksellaceae bacterium]
MSSLKANTLLENIFNFEEKGFINTKSAKYASLVHNIRAAVDKEKTGLQKLNLKALQTPKHWNCM